MQNFLMYAGQNTTNRQQNLPHMGAYSFSVKRCITKFSGVMYNKNKRKVFIFPWTTSKLIPTIKNKGNQLTNSKK